jgi:hypothetical protein
MTPTLIAYRHCTIKRWERPMHRRSTAVAEALLEAYILSRTPPTEPISIRVLTALPITSAAIFAATVVYILAD